MSEKPMTFDEMRAEQALLERIKLVYNDAGELHLYDADENDITEWPKSWPKEIVSLRTFCTARGITIIP